MEYESRPAPGPRRDNSPERHLPEPSSGRTRRAAGARVRGAGMAVAGASAISGSGSLRSATGRACAPNLRTTRGIGSGGGPRAGAAAVPGDLQPPAAV